MLKDFIAARKTIRKGIQKQFYCFWGEEDFFKQTLLKELLKKAEGYEISRFSSDLKISQVYDLLGEENFFSSKRLAIFSDFDKNDKKDKILKILRDKTPDNVLIIILSLKEPKKFKDLDKGFIIECKKIKTYDLDAIERFINSICKGTGYEIDQKAIKLLITICSNDLNFIVNELRKVFCLKQKGDKILVGDLKKVLYIKPQENIFQLIDLIVEKKEHKCLNLLEDFELTGQSSIGIVRYLAENFKTLCVILDMSKNNFNLKEISSYVKIPFFVVKNLQKNAQKLGLKKLLSFFKELGEIDIKQKSSDIDSFLLLKRFFIKACKD